VRRLRTWRPLLRLAWRDAVRSKGRSALVLVMIALPVLGVVAADVVMQTSDVNAREGLARELGAADARVSFQKGINRVRQGVDPDRGSSMGSGRGKAPLLDVGDVEGALGREVHATEVRDGAGRVPVDKGVASVAVTQLDLGDPLTDGIFEVEEGRVPGADDEVVVNRSLASRGSFAVGDPLEMGGRGTFTVVGIGESSSYRDFPVVIGPSDDLAGGAQGSRTLLVDAGPVTWSDVRALNAIGGTVLSRAVILDPPPNSELPPAVRMSQGTDDALLAVGALIVVMALIEVVLLAGPAFAVGARRQSRVLALMAATGGTPQQTRRAVLASGIVLGGLGAALGVVLGVVLAFVAMPVVQRFSNMWLGPFEVPWLHLLGIASFGLVSALLAAVVPAWIASRQDVVAVLAGRRGDRPAGRRSPILGLMLLALGIGGAVHGARADGSGEFFIAGAAILAVLGMVLLVPVVVAGLARFSSHLPLTLRYAVRDAARHRTRTVPAVAAVAATVCGVVALGIANASDAYANEATYAPMMPIGDAALTAPSAKADWPALQDALERELPDSRVSAISGIATDTGAGRYRDFEFRVPGQHVLLESYASAFGSTVLVSDHTYPAALLEISSSDRARAEAVLADGGAVVFASQPSDADRVRITMRAYTDDRQRPEVERVTVPAQVVVLRGATAPAQAVVSPAVAARLGQEATTAGLFVDGSVSREQERSAREAVAAIQRNAGLYVERGYESDSETVILLLVLGVLGGLLMLGGTLTATFLALSDARPDLATLAAVGASPRARRGVAASYAVVVGLVGAVLGTVIGFIPGVAVTYPLTGQQGGCMVTGSAVVEAGACNAAPSHYLDVPWLLIGALVVALPLLTALIVGLSTRSRLPMVARLT
jgi:putative ABC transport system permease protein